MDAFFILTENNISAMGCLHELYSLCVQNQDFFLLKLRKQQENMTRHKRTDNVIYVCQVFSCYRGSSVLDLLQ